ncbi:hypothetical protein P152DRAFT_447977 [Eremomyces bilateralis CBS 781.70]|uniref:RNA binding protein Nrd1 n=1 Tax=Eremomyces bilateralis CBS 781.70 TaxID=1392243 RepID=A0A6G1G9E9_9PEZI|nr:uncharacterized protein P152DRAFT_447977 [Eremomyces bilateralis CBS 781.70]KAF1814643.1 hypothetical protein P152DRAFT_447977 [Eremomyces bilateralis CBS 781.70]
MSAPDEVANLLQSLQTLKAPGVTKTKIEAITALCIANIKSESALVHKIASHFQRTLPTHKLGVLYVVDSVTRQWIEKARLSGQALGAAAPEGTFASGVHKMTELLPVLMNELLQVAPDNQKEKISKLIDIWERGSTFPRPMLAGFKEKLASSSSRKRFLKRVDSMSVPNESPTVLPQTSTPVPANNPVGYQQTAPAAAPQQTPAAQPAKQLSAVELLAALVPQSQQSIPQAPQPTQPPVPQASNYGRQQPQPSYPGAVNGSNGFAPPSQGISYSGPAPAQPAAQSTAGAAPPNGNAHPDPAQLLKLLQGLAAANLPPEQIAQILSSMGVTQLPNLAPPTPAAQYPPSAPQGPADYSRPDTNGSQYPRDPRAPDRPDYREPRGRSRSPDYQRRSPLARRDSPTYGVYDPNTVGREGPGHGYDRRDRGPPRRGGGDYRQRSPMGSGRDRQPTPQAAPPRAPGQKFMDWDRSIPRNHIKVLSRTLFVGGVTGNEGEIHRIFSRFGTVQSVIVNSERRHAFVKMANRQDALNAKSGMDRETDPEVLHKARSTRWGVGFGPRECNDYNSGVSIIPLDALTDADRKWMLTAEFGGSGGRPIESGMVVEEPDIEIGAGVSSKAISRRVVADPGAPRRGPPPRDQGPRDQGPGPRPRYGDRPSRPTPPRRASPAPRPEANTVGVPPQIPQFGFQMPGFR